MCRFLLLFSLPLLLTGCGPSAQQVADATAVQQSGVSPAVYDKMTHGDPLSVADICALGRARVNDGVILRYVRNQGTLYVLSSAQVDRLRRSGVSDSVIDYLLETPQYVPPPVVVYPSFYFGDPYGYGCGPYDYGYRHYHHWR